MTTLDETSQREITELLLGHSVTVVEEDLLRLDDGTELRIVPNQGGCSCSAGDYELTGLNGTENVITRVEFAEKGTPDFGQAYQIFVYTADERINLLTVEGDDGNGYYGTGYQIAVTSTNG